MAVASRTLGLDLPRAARLSALAVAGAAALTLSAKLSVPFYPVPMTMQTLVVLLVGAFLGPRLGVAAVALYLVEGALGLPVFAGTPEKGVGLAYMAGPTGGFLAGFLVAAFGVGVAMRRGWARGLVGLSLVMLAGHAAIFAFGFGWLAALIGAKAAWIGGVAPFFWATALKTGLAAAAVAAWRGRGGAIAA